MIARTFKQTGKVDTDEVSISVTLGGEKIFSGLVNANSENSVDLYSWTKDVSFSESEILIIEVSGEGNLILKETVANYILVSDLADPADPSYILGGEEIFGSFFWQTINDIACSEPLTEVTIDGKSVAGEYTIPENKQWTWTIPAGSTFQATVNVQPGSAPVAEPRLD